MANKVRDLVGFVMRLLRHHMQVRVGLCLGYDENLIIPKCDLV